MPRVASLKCSLLTVVVLAFASVPADAHAVSPLAGRASRAQPQSPPQQERQLGRPAARVLAPDRTDPRGPIALEDLRANPLPHLGRRVELALQLAPAGPAPDPLWTRFSPATWRNVRAWGDRQFPWRREHYDDAAPYLFVRAGTTEALVLSSARPHERFLVRATVREVVLGEPWIEIHTALRMAPSLGEGTVLHATRAIELHAQQQHVLALAQLERALAAPMPDAARLELERLLADWRASPRRR